MKRALLAALLFCMACPPAFCQIYRAHHTPMDAITLTPDQKKQIDKLDAKYGPKFQALLKKEKDSGGDQTDSLDALNRQYSKALLGVMTDDQKLAYLHAVYAHVIDFLHEHPEMELENVFIWGGAYAIGPNVDHLPPGYPG